MANAPRLAAAALAAAALTPSHAFASDPHPQSTRWASIVYQDGLTVWRTIDAQGMACMTCHGPDPFEIAFAGFSDEDIFRRAEPHVTVPEAQKIVDAVHLIRDTYNLPARDPMTVRPFQPGSGQPLPAASDAWHDRDKAFNDHLHGMGFR